ncbi:MAG: malto-oligosyltrehalose synthase [Actinomycetota bacterium]|nr:malto-oligosyltrehalose synthase [Actinomycetota bacterium]
MAAPPTSTYRLQLHAGFDFAAAGAVAGYLADLGVSHVYSSPLLQAAPGSTHCYDVVDHSRANSELGGEAGRQRLAGRLREAGLGWVVDVVPNHMSVAIPVLNAWWWEVLEHGPAAEHAEYFDIDWSRGRLLLPVLANGPDELDGLEIHGVELRYRDARFPVCAGTGGGSPAQVHARQHYELVEWRRADSDLNYRRFFDVTGLAGLRVELPAVFADTHREVLRWVAAGDVDGLRIDHPDGLADPEAYLARLALEAAGTWVVVEKILQPGEVLPPSWECAGTTGYDALREVAGVFLDPAGEEPLTELYADLTGEPTDFAELAYELKLRAATTSLRAETQRLARLLPEVPAAADAVAEVMACFPVYRSYLPGAGTDRLTAAIEAARRRRPDLSEAIGAVSVAARVAGGEFATRLQQTTGAVMAKGVEDCAFYRYHRLCALNEVGGSPAHFGLSPEPFHAACLTRQRDRPSSMTTLSTHDTKRSEDVRARLTVLAEMPGRWSDAVRDWAGRRPAPDANLGYLTWQTLVGAWALPPERAQEYLRKAAREAKQHTSWTDPDTEYEARLQDFVAGVYADGPLLAAIAAFAGQITPAGWSNSLGQKLTQLTMPGVPDNYQGSELWDLSLVDPDNRRPVDYLVRRDMLAELDAGAVPSVDATGAAKLHVVSQTLRLRRDQPWVFAGSHLPIRAEGPAADHLLGFARAGAVITLSTRLPVGLARRGGWTTTRLQLPAGSWTDRLTGRAFAGAVRLADLLDRLPVALLQQADLARPAAAAPSREQ